MNPLHLLWIVPVAASLGALAMALMFAAAKELPTDGEL